VSAGARFLARHLLGGPIEVGGRVGGAALRDLAGGEDVRIEAAVTLLATGAAAGPLQLFGVCERAKPSAMAGRVYVQAGEQAAAELDALCISYDRAICPGYGWLFPGPGGVVNVGVGFFNHGPPPTTRNLQRLLERFVSTFPPAARLWSRSRPLGPMKGAPLRTGLRGARLHRPGLLVTGEAAGLTYAFSGEGIGKAIEGALLAADVILRAHAGAPEIGPRYEAELRAAFEDRFRAYDLVQKRVASPRLADLLVRRARPGSYAQRELESVFNETAEPGALFSPWGMLRALVG
jgi:flavin-dependent dehydrogenase